MEVSKRNSVWLWSSIAAATAGIGVLIVLNLWNERRSKEQQVVTRLRDVQEVLTDCYDKIREIEDKVTVDVMDQVVPIAPRSLSNGSPV